MKRKIKVISAAILSCGLIGCADPLDVAVSERNTEIAIGHASWTERLASPFWRLGDDLEREISNATYALWMAEQFQIAHAWTEDGLFTWCRKPYGQPTSPDVIEGTNYRELLEVSRKHKDALADVWNVYVTKCSHADAIKYSRSYPLSVTPPRIEDAQAKYGVEGQIVEAPVLTIVNNHEITVNEIEIRWQVAFEGRDILFSEELFNHEILGGLMQGESVSLAVPGWSGTKRGSKLIDTIHRLGDVQILMRVCAEKINGKDLYGYDMLGRNNRDLREPESVPTCFEASLVSLVLVRDVVELMPKVSEVLAEPIFASDLTEPDQNRASQETVIL